MTGIYYESCQNKFFAGIFLTLFICLGFAQSAAADSAAIITVNAPTYVQKGAQVTFTVNVQAQPGQTLYSSYGSAPVIDNLTYISGSASQSYYCYNLGNNPECILNGTTNNVTYTYTYTVSSTVACDTMIMYQFDVHGYSYSGYTYIGDAR